MYCGNEYWKNYMEKWFGSELIEVWDKNVRIDKIRSHGREINLEIFESHKEDAPVIVFSHGIAGYARVLLPFIVPLFKKGYTLIVPDLQGYGYNDGLKGDFEWNVHKQNLKDAATFAKDNYKGSVWLGGASMGGPLAYAAASEIEYVDGLLCWCLWDFSDKEFMLNETSTGKATYMLIPLFKILSKLLGKMQLKTYKLISYDTLTGSKVFNELIKKDPQAGTHITLKGAASLVLDSKPVVPHSDYIKPVLVVQPGDDRMTPKKYVKRTFEMLGSTKKKYVEIKAASHFPTKMEIYDLWANEVDQFLNEV